MNHTVASKCLFCKKRVDILDVYYILASHQVKLSDREEEIKYHNIKLIVSRFREGVSCFARKKSLHLVLGSSSARDQSSLSTNQNTTRLWVT